MRILILFTIFLVSTCGLIYELVAGTLASYLLGDSITQFSTIIGTYLFAMGVGSYLSKFINNRVLETFIRIEILTGLIGGLSSAALFLCFGHGAYFRPALYAIVFLTGVCVGLEIPLIMRVLKGKLAFKDLVSQVFTFDYIGALLASLAFPIILVPYLNLIRTAVLFGLFNVGLALYLTYYFKKEIRNSKLLYTQGGLVAILLVMTFVFSDELTRMSEEEVYQESILFAKNSKYQRIVITRHRNAYSMYLNNHLQFNTSDEYRYHEALIHPTMSKAPSIKRVLILGGGDGMAAREVLKYKGVESITLVDLDIELTQLFTENAFFSKLNKHSFKDPKMHRIQGDAFTWLRNYSGEKFDVVIVDFPDPSNYSVGKLYTFSFYEYLQKCLKPTTVGVVQSTSPMYAKRSFWCIRSTIAATHLSTIPYHTYVPSFGEWGYILFGYDLRELKTKRALPETRYYTDSHFSGMRQFPKDMQDTTRAVNRLSDQLLIPIFESEWSKLFD